ncbi:MAG TPA: DUF1214 domain-containing protein [Myxococcales bacterium]|nr:DUF1214 domain-containing protein [Myxococcales bacterium]HIM01114.1 DUF1214 domain-containing protein [Myxococcales bacterium]
MKDEAMTQSSEANDQAKKLLGESWRDFCDRLKASGEAILGEGFPEAAGDRAEGMRWLSRLVVHATQMEVEAGDTQHPFFIRYETPHNQWGGPNPDNVYLRANIDPSCTYRIWANVKGMRQAIFSLNEGEMQLGEYGVFGECSLDELDVGPNGELSIILSPDEQPSNWMQTDPRGRLFTIRIYQSDWERDTAPPFHIERVGAEGISRPAPTPEFVSRALDRSANWIEKTAVYWNAYTERGWDHATPNAVGKAGAAKGGADNILYGSCFWQLAPEQALVLECDRPDADYWGFTIHTMGWLESADFADRQTSLSGHQMHFDRDDRMRVVLAHRDPGVPNWIDIGGRERGLLVYRWVWARNNPMPEAKVVDIDEVRSCVPGDHPVIDDAARRKSISHRREVTWNRFL